MVVDKSYEKIQEISDMVSYAMRADVSDPDALHALGEEIWTEQSLQSLKSGSEHYGHDYLQRDGNPVCARKGER